MGFWKTFGKWAIPAGAIAATVLTGGAASPLLGMAIGGGAGAASGGLSGGWKGALQGGLIGAGTGAVGGGALKGMGTFGNVAKQAVRYAPSAVNAARALTPNAPVASGMGGPPTLGLQQGQGFLNPLGLTADRRTQLAGMGTRNYV